jgi:hypothetical protein
MQIVLQGLLGFGGEFGGSGGRDLAAHLQVLHSGEDFGYGGDQLDGTELLQCKQ